MDNYTPRPGTEAARILNWLIQKAPYRGEVWVFSRAIAQGLDHPSTQGVTKTLTFLENHHCATRRVRDTYAMWQAGVNAESALARSVATDPSKGEDEVIVLPTQWVPSPEPVAGTGVVEPAPIIADKQPSLPSQPGLFGTMELPFRVAIFNDGKATIQKGHGSVELTSEELLELYEHISPYALRRRVA